MQEFYAVRKGRTPGVYSTWQECDAQTSGYSGAECKKFTYKSQAVAYLHKMAVQSNAVIEQEIAMCKKFAELLSLSAYSSGPYHPSRAMQREMLMKKFAELEAKQSDDNITDDTIIG